MEKVLPHPGSALLRPWAARIVPVRRPVAADTPARGILLALLLSLPVWVGLAALLRAIA